MIVIIKSQCGKKALIETRRVLDQFFERAGDRSWEGPVTQEGLITVRKLLRKTARRNTAVVCHRVRGRHQVEMEWIVGNARKFNAEGRVPTNSTGRDVLRRADENDWQTGEVIRLFAALAALFHDFGKANKIFQKKLEGNARTADPYRHEWVSLRLFEAFVGNDSDQEWLERLAGVDKPATQFCLDSLKKDGLDKTVSPFKNLPPIAAAIGWLIVSHHRIPCEKTLKGELSIRLSVLQKLPVGIRSEWCGEREDATQTEKKNCWSMHKNVLPFSSVKWCEHARRIAKNMLAQPALQQETQWCANSYVMHMARMALILADHHYSGLPPHKYYGSESFPLYANSYANSENKNRKRKQKLDEHLVGVEKTSSRVFRSIMALDSVLPTIARHKGFRKRSKDRRFAWQDKAFDLAEGLQSLSDEQGFFGINMASTGCGKTLANGRIMYALAKPDTGARFTIALGLRTLTLQTGAALRERLGFGAEDLAVLVGDGSVRQLFEMQQSDDGESKVQGSESAEELMPENEFVHYDGGIDDGALKQWLEKSPGALKLLNAPIVTCTIDHLMPATERLKGPRYIPPTLRLMTSDLVLDEPDEFSQEDFPALCRLVNWAGLLGSKVLLSSATLPPDLMEGLFDAYLAGRTQYQNNRGRAENRAPNIVCAWFDEFDRRSQQCAEVASFTAAHDEFTQSRSSTLAKKADQRRRVARLVSLPELASSEGEDRYQPVAAKLLELIQQHHDDSAQKDDKTRKRISTGLVRLANIDPITDIACCLMKTALPENYRIHLCVYHSQHTLIIRSAMERSLDAVLTRHKEKDWFASNHIRQLLDNHDEPNQILVVLSSPVCETGRDWDADWAICEPSSMRSIIQLAGRVRRHRFEPVSYPNLSIFETNLRSRRYRGTQPAFCRPGFETDEFRLNSHDLNQILAPEQWQSIDSRVRILKRSEFSPANNLVDFEHHVTRQYVLGSDSDEHSIIPASHWWRSMANLSGQLQRKQPFRYDPLGRQRYWFKRLDDGQGKANWNFITRDEYWQVREMPQLRVLRTVETNPRIGFWGVPDLQEAIDDMGEKLKLENDVIEDRFVYLDLPAKGADNGWLYHPMLGFSHTNQRKK